MSLRVIFMGSPEFAVPSLSEIIAAGHEIAAVYCQPPKPAGRGQAERKVPVHLLAEQWALPVLTPRSLKSAEVQAVFAAHDADVAVVAAYGLLLPTPILQAPRHGCLNLHPSALPRWRGAAPLQRTLMAGDRETAILIMRMDEGLDTGAICLGEQVEIDEAMTAGELHDLTARRGADLICRALVALERGSLDCRAQGESGVTYAEKISKAEARIDWSQPSDEVHNRIRGLSPFPGAWFELAMAGRVERIKVLRSRAVGESDLDQQQRAASPGTVLGASRTAATGIYVRCGTGAVLLQLLQRAGKTAMAADAFLRGMPIETGLVLA